MQRTDLVNVKVGQFVGFRLGSLELRVVNEELGDGLQRRARYDRLTTSALVSAVSDGVIVAVLACMYSIYFVLVTRTEYTWLSFASSVRPVNSCNYGT